MNKIFSKNYFKLFRKILTYGFKIDRHNQGGKTLPTFSFMFTNVNYYIASSIG